MLKNTLIAASLLSISLSASANWQMGAGYALVDDSDVTIGGFFGTVGYEFSPFDNNNITVAPEFRIGAGVKDDTHRGVEVELSSYYQVSTRVEYNFENNIYAYVVPSYNRYRTNGTTPAVRVSITDNGWGLGAGIGYEITEKASAEFSYERVNLDDDINVWSLGLKYTF